jgi:DNA-binding response OmpR family regulator
MGEVVLVRWPEEEGEGARLSGEGVAVLYLVDADQDPPQPRTCVEDWVRLPADDRDMSARVAALEARAAVHDAPPRVDDEHRLHYRGQLVTLEPAAARLADVLARRFDEAVSDGELTEVTVRGADGESRPALRAQVAQLRARLRALGLGIRRVPHRGYRMHSP